MAGVHAGFIPFNCEICTQDLAEIQLQEIETGQNLHAQSLRAQWGCEEPTQTPVWVDEDEGEEYYNCPLRFISDAVVDWYGYHSYYQSYAGTAPKYEDMPARFLEAVGYYENQLRLFMEMKQKARGRHADGLETLKQVHYNGKQ